MENTEVTPNNFENDEIKFPINSKKKDMGQLQSEHLDLVIYITEAIGYQNLLQILIV